MKLRTGVRETNTEGWGAGLIINEFPRVKPEHARTTFLLEKPAREEESQASLRAGIFHQTMQMFCLLGIILLLIGMFHAAHRAGDPIPARGVYRAMTGCDGGTR